MKTSKMPAALKRYWESRKSPRRASGGRRRGRRRSAARGSPVVSKSIARRRGGGGAVGGLFRKAVPQGSLHVGGGVLAGLIVPDWVVSKIEASGRTFGDGTRVIVRLGVAGAVAMVLGRFAGRSVALGVVGGAIARELTPLVKSRLGLSGFGDPDAVPTLSGGIGLAGAGSYAGAEAA